ncbi:helix-turn-helix transcriptional regulator [Halosolutus halophilus]|uniref:helix-turn-helix transcriptional regulator n=1 Tax=Halosolutus halophilus TaxID=1552990 RepID=UPI0022352C27|nr:MarR family transcriptional regulator [Halosolutus halophilus]
MNLRRTDAGVALLVAAVLLGGGALSWQAYQRRRAVDQMTGPMMDGSMGSMHGPNPLWYVFGTLLVAAVIGGVYLIVREDRWTRDVPIQSETDGSSSGRPDAIDPPAETPRADRSIDPEAHPRDRVLDLLPDDERRVLEPVLTSPGITQIELRDRSGFSKSKVSQTVSALEKRGLLYRERQGRTFRIYPSDELQQRQPER